MAPAGRYEPSQVALYRAFAESHVAAAQTRGT